MKAAIEIEDRMIGNSCTTLPICRPTVLRGNNGRHSWPIIGGFIGTRFSKAICKVGCSSRHQLLLVTMATDSNNAATSSGASDEKLSADLLSISEANLEKNYQKLQLQEKLEGKSILQALHEGSRILLSAIDKNDAFKKGSWLVKDWLGSDKKAWMKLFSYQAAVYALLQAVIEIANRGEGRDRDVHLFVQRSLSHQCAPLEESIRQYLSTKDPAAAEWFWSQEFPFAVSSYVNILEKDQQFAAVTSIWDGCTSYPSKASDTALLSLAISASGAVMKLGSTTLSCPQFSLTLQEEIGRLMNMLADFVSIAQVYGFACSLGLRREFFANFGVRAANNTGTNMSEDERSFWVSLIQKILRQAVVREGVRSNLRAYDGVEVLENDLAVFGFFAALGRKARSFLATSIVSETPESLASLLRYLEGASVLFYPQLSTLTFYQLFVEVVCEEMEWLPYFHSSASVCIGQSNTCGSMSAIVNICSRWVMDFGKYSAWVQQPEGERARQFLLNSQSRLDKCRELLDVALTTGNGNQELPMQWKSINKANQENIFTSKDDIEVFEQHLKLFDEDLKYMESVLGKLESLLEHSPESGNNAAGKVELEKIRRLKREAEILEASLKEKATPKARKIQEGYSAKQDNGTLSPIARETEQFEVLRHELAQLESRVKGTADVSVQLSNSSDLSPVPYGIEQGKSYGDVFSKSIEKLKDASADLWRGTQLLAIDVGSAMGLLGKSAQGKNLTEREKKALKRTLTDLASVIPIGFLMLLPVTAVGHAAILAAIQKYVPALIPSAYAPERLDLLRQLEEVKRMESETIRHEQKKGEDTEGEKIC